MTKISTRHILMIALGSAIGTGCIFSTIATILKEGFFHFFTTEVFGR